MKDYIGKHRFDILFKVIKLVLVLPHSNASEERVFSIVRKNKTTFRASMGFNTLGSILTVKLGNLNATKFKPDKALTSQLKGQLGNTTKDTHHQHHRLHHLLLLKREHRTSLEMYHMNCLYFSRLKITETKPL